MTILSKIGVSVFSNLSALSLVMISLQFMLSGDTVANLQKDFVFEFIDDFRMVYLYFISSFQSLSMAYNERFTKEFYSMMEKYKKKANLSEKNRNATNDKLFSKIGKYAIFFNIINILFATFAYFTNALSFNEIFVSMSLSFLFLLTEILFFLLVIKPWIYTTKFNLMYTILNNIDLLDKDKLCDYKTYIDDVKLEDIFKNVDMNTILETIENL